ncbi:MAG: N-acetylneuraminate synthase, partial [Oscillospiraceae bacterium]
MKPIFILAEAGVNHNGSLENAKKLVDVAVTAGVDAVKFQTFKSELLVSKFAKKAEYQEQTTGTQQTQLEMLKELELSFEDQLELVAYCKEQKIQFLSTAFDMQSIEFLETLDLPIHKIPSGEITNLPYLIRLAQTKKPIILSCGMSSLDEIEQAIWVLREYGTTDLTVLHCNTQYPTPFCDVNLRAMQTIAQKFDVKIGYSDHTLGIEVPIACAALGVTFIEKHFTLDHAMQGPDHKASLNPLELSEMVRCIRNIEQAMGNGEKII